MKIKISSTLLIIALLIPVLVVVGTHAEGNTFFGSKSITFRNEPTAIEADLDPNTADAAAAALGGVQPWWADLVNTENVANDGSGVYVAVLDTGLLPNWPSLFSQANIAWELGKGFTHDIKWDKKIGDFVFGPLRDDRGFQTELASGHGTHVTSTIVGYNYRDSFWVNGIAPQATIIPVLVLDAWSVKTGPKERIGLSGGTDEMVAAGIMYVAGLSETLDGPVVINMSLGGGSPSPMIEAAIDYAIGKGVIIVASAGNGGDAGMGWPGAHPQVISAGAGGWTGIFTVPGSWLANVPEKLNTMDALGNNWQLFLSEFSARPNIDLGQKSTDLDVVAPGSWIVGPYKSAFNPNSAWGYYWLFGTSMAAPHVAAMAALVLESHPTVDQSSMEFILKNAATGNPLSADGSWEWSPFYGLWYYFWSGNDYGSGFLMADNALRSAGLHA